MRVKNATTGRFLGCTRFPDCKGRRSWAPLAPAPPPVSAAERARIEATRAEDRARSEPAAVAEDLRRLKERLKNGATNGGVHAQ